MSAIAFLACHIPDVARTFALMEVAEEEIREAKKRHPSRAPQLDDAFRLLWPGETSAYADQLYRAHVVELLDRVAVGADTRPGTDAECLAALSDQSLVAPPGAAFGALMEQMFARVMKRSIDGEPLRGPYPGAVDELHAQLRRKLTQEKRR